MITIASFLHRDELKALMGRWLVHDFHPDDPARIKQLVNFNSLFIRHARERFSQEMLPAIYGGKIEAFPVSTKGQFKDLLIQSPDAYGCKDLRHVMKRINNYKAQPELFFREMPFEGIAYRSKNERILVAASRIKRVRRIAEKCSRRIVDAVFAMAALEISALGQSRTETPNGAAPQLDSNIEPNGQVLVEAEQRVLNGIKSGRFGTIDSPLVINDVIGFKLLGDEGVLEAFGAWVDARPDLEVIDQEEHRGNYNATNIILRWRMSEQDLLFGSISKKVERILRKRSMTGDLNAGLRRFVRDGEDTINLEILVQRYEEALESEIGRSMHEERIIRQREEQLYRGYVARNIAVLTQFLFSFALSRRVSLDEIPLKLWVRYMPETHDHIIYSLTDDFPAGELGIVP